jgi:alginate O-acetyltransferase complex protein AlgJ
MAILVGVGLVSSVAAVVAVRPALPGLAALVDGSWSRAVDAALIGDSLWRRTARRVWGQLRFSVVGEGAPGVLATHSGWLFTTEELEVGADHAALFATRLAEVRLASRALDAADVELVVALLPAKARLYAGELGRPRLLANVAGRYAEAVAVLARDGIVAPDLDAAMRAGRAEAAMFLQRDTHWTPAGAKVAAAALAPAARAALRGTSAGLQPHATTPGDVVAHEGDLLPFMSLVSRRGRARFGPEPVRMQVTAPISAGPGSAADLFATPSIPVTLVGTSYSADPRWDFAGALRVQFAADVLVVAAAGRGPFVPMQEYLASATFAETRPALVIWEIPERYFSLAAAVPAVGTQDEK